MLFLAAAAAAMSVQKSPAPGPIAATVQARVTIRILAGEAVRFGETPSDGTAIQRTTTIRTEGSEQTAKLLEFQ